MTRMQKAAKGAMLAACLALSAPAIAQGQSLNIAIQENPRVLDPVLIQNNIAYRVLPNVFETLIAVDYQDGQALKPGLAVSWERIEPTVLELELRQGVTFHDGTAFTAEDVVFSFGPERMGEGAPGYQAFLSFLTTIDSVEAIDDYTVRVSTVDPDPILELRLSGWGAQIVSKDAFEALEGDWARWAAAPVGTGPFEIAALVPSERLVLRAFEGYWGERPNVDEVAFLDVPETSTRVSGLLSGDFDIIGELPPDQIPTVEANDGFRVEGGTIQNHRVITYNMNNSWLQDVRIRQALSLAIDRQLLVDTIWQGRVEVTNGMQWPEFGPLYDAERQEPAYDPDRARELLAEAGYEGEVIPYRIRANYYPAEIIESEALVAMWQAVGINVDMQIHDSWDQVYAEPGTGIRNGSNPPLFNDPVSGLWRNYGNVGVEATRDNWQNDEFNALGRILLTSLDTGERAAAHKAMLDIFHDQDPPSAILHALGQFYGVREGIAWTPYNVAFMDLGAGNLSAAPAAR